MTYERIVRHFIFPLQQKFLGGGALEFMREWERTQWLEPEQIRRLQLERLKKLLAHAARNVPYYRESFRRVGFEAGDLKSISDLALLPVLDKSDLREHTAEFVTEGLREDLGTAKTINM